MGALTSKPRIPPEIPVPESPFCSCILTARHLGLDLPAVWDAAELRGNTAAPKPGDGLLLKYARAAHVAVIKKIDEKGFHVAEGNYKRCKYTERVIPFGQKSIRGFYRGEGL